MNLRRHRTMRDDRWVEPRTSLIGREPELARIEGHVRSTQLVTLSGPGGVGKTRLAIETARRLEPEAGGGVHVVDLAPLPLDSTRDEVGEALVSTMGLTSIESVVGALQQQPTLLLFDNCEHLRDGVAELVESLLEVDSELRVLATSRIALDLSLIHI